MRYRLQLLLTSILVLIPCFWHPQIEATDLGSHAYNAWLVQLIEHKQAPGLIVVQQWSNVLFDEMLTDFALLFGLQGAQIIAVSLSVLLFFWAAFALVAVVSEKRPWFLVPVLAALCYGWTFSMGFFNYYISLGLSFIALALLWRPNRLRLLLALLLLPLIFMAHYFGLALLLGILAYRWLAQHLRITGQAVLLAGSIVTFILMRIYVTSHFPVVWPKLPAYFRTGADQFILFSPRYRVIALLLELFVVVVLALELYRRRREQEFISKFAILLQLYLLIESMVILFPQEVMLPFYGRPSGDLSRLTVFSAIFVLCMLGSIGSRRCLGVGLGVLATVFFVFLWGDTGRINSLESQIDNLLRSVPRGSRIVTTYWLLPGSRITFQHIVERACINECFVYDNFEPSSRQFRVRAVAANPIVEADPALTGMMESGRYVIQPRDVPIYQIYLCNLDPLQACLHQMSIGELVQY